MTIYVGSFTILEADTSKQITGVGFEPTAILFWHMNNNRNAVGSWDANLVPAGGVGFGFTTADEQACYTNAIQGDVDNHPSARIYNQNYCFMRAYNDQYTGYGGEVNVWGAIDGAISLSSFDTDGFTVTVDVDFAADCKIMFMAIQAPNAAIIHINRPASIGNQAYTGVGFQPDCLFSIHGYMASGSTKQSDSRGGIGFSDGSNDACFDVYDGHGLGAVDSKISFNTSEFINMAIANRASVYAFDGDGFTLNWLEVAGTDYPISVLCLGGVEAYVGTIQTSTGGSNIVETGVGFEPEGLFMMGSYYGQAAQDAWVDSYGTAWGGTSSPTTRACMGYEIRDGTSVDSDCTEWAYEDAVMVYCYDQALISKMDLVGFDPDGFTVVMDDVDTAARDVAYIALRIIVTDYRARLTRYLHNTYQSRKAGRPIFRDVLGRDVPSQQLEVDSWIFSGGAGFPTPVKYENQLEDPFTFYSESISGGGQRVRIETSRESFFKSIMRRLARS